MVLITAAPAVFSIPNIPAFATPTLMANFVPAIVASDAELIPAYLAD